MKTLREIPKASDEVLAEGNPSEKSALAQRLEAEGHQTVCIGRALVVLERAEFPDDVPEEIRGAWGVLRITVYPDPDVAPFGPTYLYVDAGRFGVQKVVMETKNEAGQRRIFELQQELVRDEFK